MIHISSISKVTRRAVVPILAATFVSLASLASPVTELPAKTINGKRYYCYKVVKKETLYSLSRKLGLTQEQIIFYNPTVYDGLKANDVLYFPADDFAEEDKPSAAKQTSAVSTAGNTQTSSSANDNKNSYHGTRTHDVVKGETIYGISHRYGITTEALMDANPAIRSGLKTGMSLIIPDVETSTASKPTTTPTTTSKNSLPSNASNEDIVRHVESQVRAQRKRDASSIDIAVLLSFDLDAEKKSREAQYSLEFYKGFLLAVDTLREFDRPIHITTYDVASSADNLKSILAKLEMKHVQVIIPPADLKGGLDIIGDFGRQNDVMVFNLFNVRDRSYLTNPAMMQASVPQDVMCAKAVEGFMDKYKHHTPVLLMKDDAQADRNQFMSDIKTRLTSEGINFVTIPYSGDLTPEALATLSATTDYVFVPTQSSQRDLNRVIDSILKFRENSSGDLTIFGYPEWITYRGETLDNLHKLNATYYSRFVDDSDDRYTKHVIESFKEKFGTQISASVPRPGIMGFDSGIFLLRTLKSNNGDFASGIPPYQGVQNGFKFRKASDNPDAGWYNERVMLINYRPGGSVDYQDL